MTTIGTDYDAQVAHGHGVERAAIGPVDRLWYADSGLFSYLAGMAGAAAFTLLNVGPGWLGFLVVYLAASVFAAWVVAPHV